MVRTDLGMGPGKIVSQCGHGLVGAVTLAPPSLIEEYHKDMPSSPGTKVCLQA
ncbi:peptidyl-tRNA hydrolase, partial [Streptococcus pneumoniae]|uniref:peptidyl-tRNA hydrolase n=1 Tax=Streptococcus pneumoniae TaxID=1313 RepID=UPI0039B6F65B